MNLSRTAARHGNSLRVETMQSGLIHLYSYLKFLVSSHHSMFLRKKKRILSTTTQEVMHHVEGWDRWLLHKMRVFSLVIVSPEPINPDKGISNATLQSGLPRRTWLTKWIWFFDVSLIVYWFRFLTWFTRGELTYQRTLYMYDRAYPKRLRNWTTTKWSVILYSSSYWQFLY